jgi:hypothetical protein
VLWICELFVLDPDPTFLTEFWIWFPLDFETVMDLFRIRPYHMLMILNIFLLLFKALLSSKIYFLYHNYQIYSTGIIFWIIYVKF